MSRKKLTDIVKKQDKSIKEIYEEYIKQCISIGQSHGTIESNTKDKLENHVVWMKKEGIWR
ncbi:hypothetical protein ACJDU8_25060 [Clostridium sp. WILCCON 0269]|uniref:Uncharacterized protein n=1 Tax=Candidatus Clostridium eludens TaxID=3381663 RepID=A0ABW8SUI7_9CLOT